MPLKKKVLWNTVFLLLVFGLTMYAVFYGEDLGAMMDSLRRVDPLWLLPALALVVAFIWGESLILWQLMRAFHIRLKKSVCFLFSCVGFFFSGITPSASGGQPMQIYYMKKEDIPIPVASVALLMVTIFYKLVLATIGLGLLLFGQVFMLRYLSEVRPVFYLGLVLTVGCIIGMLILLFHPALAEALLHKGLTLLERLRLVRRGQTRHDKLHCSMDVYRQAAGKLRSHKWLLVKVFFITFAQRLALFAVPCVVYLAFGLSGVPLWDILLLQAVVAICVDMLPLPGGMGISEALFMRMFTPVFQNVMLPSMVLSRGIGFYCQLLISALFTGVTQLYYTFGRRQDKAA